MQIEKSELLDLSGEKVEIGENNRKIEGGVFYSHGKLIDVDEDGLKLQLDAGGVKIIRLSDICEIRVLV